MCVFSKETITYTLKMETPIYKAVFKHTACHGRKSVFKILCFIC